MSTASRPAWAALPAVSEAQARAFNRLAAHCGFGGLPLEVLGVRCEVRWCRPLPCYPLSFHLHTRAGRVRIGCDLGALWPELAAGGLREMLDVREADGAPDAHDIRDDDGAALLAFLLGEWIDLIERVLGQSVTLQRLRFDPRWPRAHWALRVVDAQGHSGTVAFDGPAIYDALGVEQPRAPRRHDLFAQVPFTLAWRVAGPALAVHQLDMLVEHAVLLLDEQPVELCLAALHGRICIRGSAQQGAFMVTGVDLKTDDHFQASPVESGLVPIDMIMASIDVLLDTLVMPLSEIVALAPGSVLGLAQLQTGRAVTLRCNGAPFARGEVIAVGQRLGVLITQKAGVIEGPPAAESVEGPPQPPMSRVRRAPGRRPAAPARRPARASGPRAVQAGEEGGEEAGEEDGDDGLDDDPEGRDE